MMTTIRSKMMTLMTLLTVLLSFTFGGCSDDPETAAQELLRVTKDGNVRLGSLLDNDKVVTAEIVVDILAPIHHATENWNEDIQGWEANPPSDAYIKTEVETFRKAGVELDRLLTRLDSIGFLIATAEEAFELCEAEPTPTDPTDPSDTGSGSGSGSGVPTAFADSDPYGWRYTCYAGCTAAAAACAAACTALIVPPLTPASVGIVACYAACATVSGACINECSMLKCW